MTYIYLNLTLKQKNIAMIGRAMKLAVLGVVLAALAKAAAPPSQAKSGCETRCGNIAIPYPFGTTDGCYLDETFFITCNTTFNPPKPFLGTGNIEVLNVSVAGELRALGFISRDCYNKSGKHHLQIPSWLWLRNFSISKTKNKFTAMGCDTYAWIQDYRVRDYATGCMSLCPNMSDVVNGSCSGIGCCQTAIPKESMGYFIRVGSINNHTYVQHFNPCSYAFVVEEGSFTFSTSYLYGYGKKRLPLILDWSIGNQRCKEAMENPTSYACKKNSVCNDTVNGPGYRCGCVEGYQGNPYLDDGCEDINECKNLSLNDCTATCHNLPGSYNCSCPEGYKGDGRKTGAGCSPKGSSLKDVALGISMSLLGLLLGISWLYFALRQRKLRKKFFRQNGGILLQQELSKLEGRGEVAKVYTAEDLKKATDNYDESRIIGQGGQGTVYKGILADNRVVAIKKSRIGDQRKVDQFINEVIVLSQINHRNVVKLLGCCLETRVPMLVYEFVTNGTLFDHLHNSNDATPFPWETRVQIAIETAGALSYLHSAASTPIIHRDIKLTNILLDDNFVAKVSDFGASRLMPSDQSELTTLVQGTIGYLDPEYLHTGQLTEKSDVYSFGVVLVELLTGKKAVDFGRPEEERSLVVQFVCFIKENRLLDILDQRVLNDSNVDELKEVAMLARSCVRVNAEERPTMKEVAIELEGLRGMEKHPWDKGALYGEENEYLLGHLSDATYLGGCSSSSVMECSSSIQSQVTFGIEGGR